VWQPDTFQVPRAVIVAELAGEIPVGSTMATVAFLLSQVTTKEQASATVKSFRLDQSAAKIAWRFVGTGKLVTLDGEVLYDQSNGYRSSPTNTPTVPSTPSTSDSEKPSEPKFLVEVSLGVIAETWAKHMTGEPQLTTDEMKEVRTLLGEQNQTVDWLVNILLDIKNTGNAKKPISLMMWKLRNESPEKSAQNAERHRLHPPPVDNVIKGAMERARAEIAANPPAQTTDKTVERLSKLKERMGGKPQRSTGPSA
jgi:hypothetical protein